MISLNIISYVPNFKVDVGIESWIFEFKISGSLPQIDTSNVIEFIFQSTIKSEIKNKILDIIKTESNATLYNTINFFISTRVPNVPLIIKNKKKPTSDKALNFNNINLSIEIFNIDGPHNNYLYRDVKIINTLGWETLLIDQLYLYVQKLKEMISQRDKYFQYRSTQQLVMTYEFKLIRKIIIFLIFIIKTNESICNK